MINTSKLKEELKKEEALLLEELKKLGQRDKKTGDWVATPIVEEIAENESDEGDRADHSEDYEERTAILNALEPRLVEVRSALAMIDSKEYGICVICKKHIEDKRMEANPAARTCIEHREEII